MPLNQKKFEDTWQRFRIDFADFNSFEQPGRRYSNEMRAYKDELVRLYDEVVRPKLDDPKSDFFSAFISIMKRPRSTTEAVGTLHWTTIDNARKLSPEESSQYGQLLSQVVKANASPDSITKYGAVASELWGARGRPGEQRDFVSLLLMLHDPENFMYDTLTHWNKSSNFLSGELLIKPGSRINGEEYVRCQNFGKQVRRALEGAGFSPKDMIDVQSFLWSVDEELSEREPNDLHKKHIDAPNSAGSEEPSIADLTRTIRSKRMKIDESVIRQYHFSMRTRGFVILAGPSGVGKTWLTSLYANAINANYLVAPVAPNWSTNEDLLGFFNPIDGKFHATRFLNFIDEAAELWNRVGSGAKEFHLVLDEMNLARVEHYFSLFLSLMERRRETEIPETRLTRNRVVRIPPNLKFAGTVNMDETTHGFADKVFDRAQLIELSISPNAAREHVSERIGETPPAEVLLDLWDRMAPTCPVGFRVLDEIADYLKLAEQEAVDWREALDEQIVSKLLPKLRGIDPEVAEVLKLIETRVNGEFPKSAAKCQSMLRRVRSTDVVSFF